MTSWNDLWDPKLKNEILMVDGLEKSLGLG